MASLFKHGKTQLIFFFFFSFLIDGQVSFGPVVSSMSTHHGMRSWALEAAWSCAHLPTWGRAFFPKTQPRSMCPWFSIAATYFSTVSLLLSYFQPREAACDRISIGQSAPHTVVLFRCSFGSKCKGSFSPSTNSK